MSSRGVQLSGCLLYDEEEKIEVGIESIATSLAMLICQHPPFRILRGRSHQVLSYMSIKSISRARPTRECSKVVVVNSVYQLTPRTSVSEQLVHEPYTRKTVGEFIKHLECNLNLRLMNRISQSPIVRQPIFYSSRERLIVELEELIGR